jgi:photosystem II stability/assembly factor-like uncharacterized protein
MKKSFRKKSLLLLSLSTLSLISIVSISFSQEYWLRQQSPTTNHLYRCFFTDTLNGWAAGDSGIIIHTSNAGVSWVIQPSYIDYAITDLFFINNRLGWGIANDYYYAGTTILKTTNGGDNWDVSRYPDTSLIINTVYFLDSLHGLMGGYEGAVLRTSTGGAAWQQYRLDTNSLFSHFPIRRFTFYNSQVGLACGGIMDIAGLAWKTTNGGLNWEVRDTTPEPLYDVVFLDSLKAFTTGGDFEYGSSFSKSTNSGVDWRYDPVGYFGQGSAIAIRTPTEIWVPLGFSQRWMVSYDTAKGWYEVLLHDSTAVYDAVFVDSLHGWAVGYNGAIYKYNSNLIGIKNRETNLPLTVNLFQNYPNPFNPATTIAFDLSLPANVRIILYDILGRRVRVLYEGFKSAGMNKIVFDAGDLSSGVYFYELEAGIISRTKKMVILK